MQTHSELRDTHRAILAAREARKLTTREFAAELGVSQNAVYQWENGIAEPTGERVAAWIADRRDWVRELGVKVFAIKFGPVLSSLAAGGDKATAA